MARAILERELTEARTSRVRFDLAGPADEADIRRLLRETPMAGAISISLEREPDYFADVSSGETKQTIVARDQGRLVCTGSCAIRKRFMNRAPQRVGYLGGLRLAANCSGRFDILRRGYELFRELQTDAPADFYFTSIATDNHRARKFLERGFSGMPLYEFVGEFVTVLIPTRGCLRQSMDCGHLVAGEKELVALSALLNESNAKYQFSPCWSADDLLGLQSLGLRASHFCVARDNGNLSACGAVWDQRGFKQTVIRDYSPWLKLARPLLNGISRFTNGSRLPRVGETLAGGFASHVALTDEEAKSLPALIAALRRCAWERRMEFVTAGFAANDPRLKVVRNRFPSHEYRSRLYVVRWKEIGGSARELDGRLINPEVSLL